MRTQKLDNSVGACHKAANNLAGRAAVFALRSRPPPSPLRPKRTTQSCPDAVLARKRIRMNAGRQMVLPWAMRPAAQTRTLLAGPSTAPAPQKSSSAQVLLPTSIPEGCFPNGGGWRGCHRCCRRPHRCCRCRCRCRWRGSLPPLLAPTALLLLLRPLPVAIHVLLQQYPGPSWSAPGAARRE